METVRYGEQGYKVLLMQLGLKRAGQDLALDGIFGRGTARALTSFQREQGLSADGIAGKLTWTALYPYLAGYVFYQVRRGDSFYSVAQRYGTTAAALAVANPQADPMDLRPGAMLTVPLDFSLVTEEIPYSHILCGLILKGLEKRYPFITLTTIGSSVMGRPLLCARMGRGRRQVFCNAAHHANEWITTPVLLKFLEEYAFAYAFAAEGTGEEAEAKDMYAKATAWLVPMVNPDGVDLVTGALPEEDSYYKQAEGLASYYPGIPFPSGWKANISGTDLNLQYPAGWEEAQRIKYAQGFVRPGPRDYVGPSPLSAPESRAVADFTRKNVFDRTLSYHTQGQVLYWQYKDIYVSGAEALTERYAEVSGYTMEQVPEGSSNAGYKDWFIDTYRKPGCTVEAGKGMNPLPLSQFPEIYRANRRILVEAMLYEP